MSTLTVPQPTAAPLSVRPTPLLDPWVWRMAWRDSRRSRGRLLVFSTALTLGVAALVAIGSLGWNIDRAINEQARSLVGADLVVESRDSTPVAGAADFIASLGGEQAQETRLASMAEFPKTGASRLAQVRAMQGDFPFYGEIETSPPEAIREFRQGRGALIEESLFLQYGLHRGDEVKIGGRAFPVLGTLRKLPSQANAFASIAPRVLIPLAQLPVALTSRGSLVHHATYIKLPPTVSVPELVRLRRADLRRFHLETETVDHRKRELGQVFDNVNHFLNLVSFVALLLGGIGVASAIHAHLKQKQRTVAVLRCLGASSGQTLTIYLLQALGLGLAGALGGALVGIAIQGFAPLFLKGVLPIDVKFGISWLAVVEGVGVGFLTCALFVLLPLLPVRRVPPLLAIRSAYESAAATPGGRRDPLLWLTYVLLALALLLFPWAQSRNWRLGLGFSGALFVSFGLLALVARGLMTAARRYFPRSWPFEWRQGLANLYRPNNRTFLMVFTLGLSTFLLLGLYLTKDLLLHQFATKENAANQPNLVFFDIQPDQKDAVAGIVRAHGLPVMGTVSVVTMRLTALKGRSVDDIAGDHNKGRAEIPEWRLRHEYRSTYRDSLTDTEEIVAGRWQGKMDPKLAAGGAVIPVSLEEEAAKDMHLGVGDTMDFDVQSVPMKTKIASIRKVDWSRFSPNFFVVFPTGVLEDAPTFNVLVTRTGSAEVSGALQGEVVRRFPTVSAIDLSLIVATITGIVNKATTAVRFLSIFTVGTGLLVLAAAILTGRYERVREGVLLRTLGASRRQIFRILVIEYLCLGSLSALTGILLAGAGSWALAIWVFKVPWAPSPLSMLASWFIVAGLTVAIGLLASRGVCDHPPLEALRGED